MVHFESLVHFFKVFFLLKKFFHTEILNESLETFLDLKQHAIYYEMKFKTINHSLRIVM